MPDLWNHADGLASWLWLAGGVALIAAEMIAPGAVLMWFGAGAVVCGVLFAAWPLPLNYQLLVFAVLSLGALAAGRPLFVRWMASRADPEPGLNRRGAAMVGARGVLSTPLAHGRGRVHLGDSEWSCTGPDLPAGSPVRVVAVDGNTVRVETDGAG